jgi:uncharacterized Zn-binding protein involved in type VI secretion
MKTARVNLDVGSGSILVDGAKTVFINTQPVALLATPNARGAVVVAGSPDVYVEGRPVARVGDALSDGGNITTGSLDVFTNSP